MSVIPSSLSYKRPLTNISTNGNGEQIQFCSPNNGTTFPSDNNSILTFNLASSNQFWKTNSSFFSATIVARNAAGEIVVNAATTHSTILASVISRVRILVGAQEIESLNSYPALLSHFYSTAPLSKKAFLKMSEAYGETGSLQATGGRRIHHAIASSFLYSEQSCPLPAISGGCTIELTVNDAKNVFTSANVAKFTLENPVFVYSTVQPSPQYTLKLLGALEQNRALSLPMVRTKSFLYYGNGGTENLLQVPLGNITSLQSIAVIFRRAADVSNVTLDKANIHINPGLVGVRMEIGGSSIPASRTIRYSDGSNGQHYDPEMLVIGAMNAAGSVYDADQNISFDPAVRNASNFSFYYNFTSTMEYHGDGFSLEGAASQNLSLYLTTNAAIPVTTSIHVFAFVDEILEIKKDFITSLVNFNLE